MIIQKVVGAYRYHDGTNFGNAANQLMLLSNGTSSIVMGAGSNAWGMMADGTATARTTATRVTASLGTVTDIGWAGSSPGAVFALNTSGSLYSWGMNVLYQTGNPNAGTTTQLTASLVLTGVTGILANNLLWDGFDYNACTIIAEKADGYYRAGSNSYAAVGTGDASTNILGFQEMNFPSNVRLKFVGATTNNNDRIITYAVSTEDKIYAWGDNVYKNISNDVGAGKIYSPIEVTGQVNYR
jgi:alpha-tubulin suppressor-like RCC1 family protein